MPDTAVDIVKKATEAHAQLIKLQSALERAKQGVKKASADLARAKMDLSTASAKGLTNGPSDQPLSQSKALADAHAAQERSRLAYTGCERALAAFDATPLLQPLHAALEQQRTDAITAYMEEVYRPAATLYADALRVGQAVAAGLGLKLDKPDLPPSSQALATALQRVPDAGSWKTDPVSVLRHEAVKSLNDTYNALVRFQAVKGENQRFMTNHPVPASFNGDGTYRVVRKIRLNGVDIPPGQVVTRFDLGVVGVHVLAQLAHNRHVVEVSDTQQVSA